MCYLDISADTNPAQLSFVALIMGLSLHFCPISLLKLPFGIYWDSQTYQFQLLEQNDKILTVGILQKPIPLQLLAIAWFAYPIAMTLTLSMSNSSTPSPPPFIKLDLIWELHWGSWVWRGHQWGKGPERRNHSQSRKKNANANHNCLCLWTAKFEISLQSCSAVILHGLCLWTAFCWIRSQPYMV